MAKLLPGNSIPFPLPAPLKTGQKGGGKWGRPIASGALHPPSGGICDGKRWVGFDWAVLKMQNCTSPTTRPSPFLISIRSRMVGARDLTDDGVGGDGLALMIRRIHLLRREAAGGRARRWWGRLRLRHAFSFSSETGRGETGGKRTKDEEDPRSTARRSGGEWKRYPGEERGPRRAVSLWSSFPFYRPLSSSLLHFPPTSARERERATSPSLELLTSA